MKHGKRHPPPWLRVYATTLIALLLSLGIQGCSLGLGSATLTQQQGFPTLHRLDWPSGYYSDATWSPNGRWIAALAGSDYAGSQLTVVSPDGTYERRLTAWGCGEAGVFAFAWLPDSSLSCITQKGQLIRDAYPFTHPQTISLTGILAPTSGGAVWLQHGPTLVVASLTDPADPAQNVGNGALYLVQRNGTVVPQPLTQPFDDVTNPRAPLRGGAMSYVLQVPTSSVTWRLDVVLSKLSFTSSGLPTLMGTPQVLATDVDENYSWSPSGHWLALRHLSYHGGDKIYLLNPDNPAQVVDVVVADQVEQQMTNPIWSPDGKTLVVFSVGVHSSQPYKIDIGAYLASKGLQS